MGIRILFCAIRCFGQFVEGGASVISSVMHQLNEDIRDKELRLIGSGGAQLGIMSADEALRIAEEQGMDLMDYLKQTYRYQEDRVSQALAQITGEDEP